jgi:cysteine desulfurase
MSDDSQILKTNNNNYFFDAQSTTPIDGEVLSVINEILSNGHANPHSSHRMGQHANQIIQSSIEKIQQNLDCLDYEVLFTSGATESNNLIIKGLRDYLYEHQLKAVTLKTEHKCILNSFDYLARNGVEVEYLDVQNDGLLDLNLLEKKLDGAGLLSVMYVNNEIGVVQPIQEISKLAHTKGAIIHSDIAQAMGRLPVQLEKLGLDAVSISGHKFYGPQGIGLAILNQELKSILKPLIVGGGQQSNLRSGTMPTALCAAIAKSVELFQNKEFIESQYANHLSLFNHFIDELKKEKIVFSINGSLPSTDIFKTSRVPSNINIAFAQFDAFSLMNKLPNFMISTGSACSAGEFDYSHVLKALNLSFDDLKNSVRISFEKSSNLQELEKLLEAITEIHQKI